MEAGTNADAMAQEDAAQAPATEVLPDAEMLQEPAQPAGPAPAEEEEADWDDAEDEEPPAAAVCFVLLLILTFMLGLTLLFLRIFL